MPSNDRLAIYRPTERFLRVLKVFVEHPKEGITGYYLIHGRYNEEGKEDFEAAGVWPGSVYQMLARLVEYNWVTSVLKEAPDTGIRRRRPARIYHYLTELGQKKGSLLLKEHDCLAAEITHEVTDAISIAA